MTMRFNNPVQLRGQCILKLDTGMTATHITINKVNNQKQNNADVLIDDVLHFAIMRLGSDRLLDVVNKKIAEYKGDYKEQGLFPDFECKETAETTSPKEA